MPKNTLSMSDEIKLEQQKIADRPLKDKISYIIYYYKFHFIFAMIALFIIGTVVHTYLTQKDIVLDCVMVNTIDYFETAEDIGSDFAAFENLNTKKQEVVIDTTLKLTGSDGDMGDELSYNSLAKLLAMFSAGTLDCLVSNNEMVEIYSQQGLFSDLRDVLDEDTYAQLFEDNRLYLSMNSFMEAVPVGVILTGNKKLSDAGLYNEDDVIIMTFPNNSENTEYAVKFLEYLLKEQ